MIDFSRGYINPIKFKAIRVAHGVYEQRQEHTYMIRIRCAAGGITPKQLKKVGSPNIESFRELFYLSPRSQVEWGFRRMFPFDFGAIACPPVRVRSRMGSRMGRPS